MLKIRVLKGWGICLLGIACIVNSSVQAADDKLIIGTESWPPYIDKGHPRLGVATEIVTTALDRAGYNVDNITFGSWHDILNGGGIGAYDVIIAGWHSEEREKYFEFSEPYLFNEIKFIKKKGRPYKYETLGDLKGVLVGIVQDYAYSSNFDNSDIPIKIPSRHIIQNLLLLQQGKIDLTLDDEWVIRYQMINYMPNMIDQFEIIDHPLARRGLHLLVSLKNNQHKKIINDFNNMIEEMKSVLLTGL